VICSNFNGEATIVGEADTLEAAFHRQLAIIEKTFGPTSQRMTDPPIPCKKVKRARRTNKRQSA
jgi:hypothetical protein